MKILMINNNNPLRASGVVALDLFNGLRGKGHEVKLLVNEYSPDYPVDIITMETFYDVKRKNLLNRIDKRIKFRKTFESDIDYHFHRLREKDYSISIKKLMKKARISPDIILILFAKNFVNSKNIYELSQLTHAPVLWLMYDMAPLTGGCHYAWDCKGYQNSCGCCPGIFSKDPFDATYENLLQKKTYTDLTNIHLIAASEWQYRQAISSTLFGNKIIHKALLSVDSDIFTPVDKKEMRLKMNIPVNKKIIFFGAVYFSTRRKGMVYLLESLNILKKRLIGTDLENNILLLVAGRETERQIDSWPFQYLSMGFLNNNIGIASAFQIADVFLCSSIEDSGPQMINQSIMCGTPVVAFEMGVSLDLVISGQTGYRAKLKDSNDLAEGLFNVLSLDQENYKKLSDSSRNLAMQCCLPETQIRKIETIMNNSITA